MLELININELRAEAERKIKYYEEQKEIFNIIKEVFKKSEGKQLNKRIANTLKNELNKIDEKINVSYNKDSYGWYNFYIWNSNEKSQIDYNNRILLMFTEENTDDGKINYNKFIQKFTWLDNPIKNISEVKTDLNRINNTNIIEEYNKAIETINKTKDTLKALKYSLNK